MNYKKIHDNIIDRAKNRNIKGYVEKHLHENYYIILEVDSKNKHILTLQRRFISSGSNEKIIEIP